MGVYGAATSTIGSTYGGRFISYSLGGIGVSAVACATAGATYGIEGISYSSTGVGVLGSVSAAEGDTYGVHGRSFSTSGRGVYGEAWASTGYTRGVYGSTESTDGTGVYGGAYASTGINYGVRGCTYSNSGYAGYFTGDLHVTGTLSKGGGSFLIDHPLDPENKLLRHNFVESPENLLIYRGKAECDGNGEAIVQLPDYFTSLVKEDEATIYLTPKGRPFLTGAEWNTDQRSMTIYGDAGREVFWAVFVDRDDPVIRKRARPVEEDKGPDNKYCDRGKLLYPEAYGYPETMGRDYREEKID